MNLISVEVKKGDITSEKTDAIVNAANSSLMGGGGVDGAIHRAGGPEILEECREIISRIGRCETGQAVHTTAGNLPAQYVIHTVGPVWNGGKNGEDRLLASCYKNSLSLAEELSCTSVSFPNISTGVYGYPKQKAAEVALNTIGKWLEKHSGLKVILVCFDDENYGIYREMISK
ncbi:MAG: O-acetyl-ADP-ribose deacetylase [Cyclobacteriaceae bacterium]